MDAVVEMKKSVVKDFLHYMEHLMVADYSIDTSNMMAKIMFIESAVGLDKYQHIFQKLV